jgi:hypothetical protein
MTEIRLNALYDVFVYNATGERDDNKYGAGLVTYHLDTRRTYIKFDLSEVSTVGLTSARIYYRSTVYDGAGVNHFRCTSNWVHTTITWNNQPTFSSTSMGRTPNWTQQNKWYSCALDLTEFGLMVANNYGMCGKGTIADISTGYGTLYFVPSYRPYLVLTYSASTGQVILFS